MKCLAGLLLVLTLLTAIVAVRGSRRPPLKTSSATLAPTGSARTVSDGHASKQEAHQSPARP